MKKSSLAAIAIVVIMLAVVGFVVSNGNKVDKALPQQDATNQTDATDNSNTETSQVAEQPAPTSQAAAKVTVDITNSAFQPQKITVKKGGTVTWTNKDSIRHDVHPDTETNEFKKSELLDRNESYSVTFNTVGTYSYFCTPHPFMKGTVEVVE